MRYLTVLLLLCSAAQGAPPAPVFEGLDPEAWAERLASEEEATRKTAVERLNDGGSTSVLVIIPLLSHANVRVRIGASEALWRMTGGVEKAIPALLEACRDADSRVRANAASALGPMEGRAKAAVPVLTGLLGDADAEVRRFPRSLRPCPANQRGHTSDAGS